MVKIKERKTPEKFKRFARFLYIKFFRIHDSPLKIALGFGLGVFTAVMPGAGPIATLVLAFIFRVNRASALLGCIIFNTWLGFVTFLLAVKTGSAIMGLNYHDVYSGWSEFIKNFSWPGLFKLSFYNIIAPICLGYLMISLILSFFMTVIVFIFVYNIKHRKIAAQNRVEL